MYNISEKEKEAELPRGRGPPTQQPWAGPIEQRPCLNSRPNKHCTERRRRDRGGRRGRRGYRGGGRRGYEGRGHRGYRGRGHRVHTSIVL